MTNHPVPRDLPFFLETPQDDLSGWGREIAALRAAHTEAAALNHEEVHAEELQAAGGQHEQVKIECM